MRALWIGTLCGFLVAAPPGPLGAVCVQRSLRAGRRAGLCCGMAIAAGDGLHALGACLLASQLDAEPGILRRVVALAAALVLFALSWRALRRPSDVAGEARAAKPTAVFLLALLTPGTLPAFLLLFSTFDVRGAPLAVVGACLASFAWSVVLVLGLELVRERATLALAFVDRACGWLLCLGACGAARVALFG